MRAAIDFMNTNLHRKLPTGETARAAGISSSRLRHLFKDEVSKSLTRFRRELQLHKAKQLLETTNLSVKEVAGSVGINTIMQNNIASIALHECIHNESRSRETMIMKKLFTIAFLTMLIPAATWAQSTGAWTQWTSPLSPTSRNAAVMAYDATHSQVVLFGGIGYAGVSNETWLWDGGHWTKQSPVTSPPARQEAVMAYDAARGKMVLFGGRQISGSSYLNDTWTWDGTNWTQLSPAASPSARAQASMAYDAALGKVVLFGGFLNGTGQFSDTWSWDGTNWIQELAPVSPPRRQAASMAYDGINQRMLLFGGNTILGLLNDTWAWNGTTWLPLAPTSSPSSREFAAMAQNMTNGKIVLFGGNDTFNDLGDTWTWDGSTWTQESPPVSPYSRRAAVMAYDGAGGQFLLFGGLIQNDTFLADTWAWDGSNWTRAVAPPVPSGRYLAMMAFHKPTSSVMLFGGVEVFGFGGSGGSLRLQDTWTWDGNAWAQQSPSTSPPARDNAAVAEDASHGTVVVFGGFDGSLPQGDTWTWDGRSWSRSMPAHSPSARRGARMAYDVARGNIVLFGGFNETGGASLSDTWIWDGTDWTQQFPATSPQGRHQAGMAYDPASQTVLMFGGNNGSGYGPNNPLKDTWSWDGTSWTQRSPSTLPPARFGAAMAVDPSSCGLALFGGDGGGTALGDTWLWHGSNWTQKPTASSPRTRTQPNAASDPVRGTVVLFGGTSTGADWMDDTWLWKTSGDVMPVQLVSVGSRKVHGGAGPFDINLPISGTPGIECRTGGANGDHQIVFSFANTLTGVGSASVVGGTGTVSSNLIGSDAHEYIVNLTGVTNAQLISVTLSNVNDSVGNSSCVVSASMGVLLGDMNGSGRVDAADVSLVRQQTLQQVTTSNFREDINTSGRIDAADVSIARQQTLTSLP